MEMEMEVPTDSSQDTDKPYQFLRTADRSHSHDVPEYLPWLFEISLACGGERLAAALGRNGSRKLGKARDTDIRTGRMLVAAKFWGCVLLVALVLAPVHGS